MAAITDDIKISFENPELPKSTYNSISQPNEDTSKPNRLSWTGRLDDSILKNLLGWTGQKFNIQTYSVNIYNCYLTDNECFSDGRPICATNNNRIQGIVINSADRQSEYLRSYVQPKNDFNFTSDNQWNNNDYETLIEMLGVNTENNHWNTPRPDGEKKCVHAFVGWDNNGKITVVNTLPYNFSCWGCGTSSPNFNDSPNGRVQIHLCSNDNVMSGSTLTLDNFIDTMTSLAMYCAYLCMRIGIDPNLNSNEDNTAENILNEPIGMALNVFGRELVTENLDSKFIYDGMLYHKFDEPNKKIYLKPSNARINLEIPPKSNYYATYVNNTGSAFYPMRVSNAVTSVEPGSDRDWYVPTILSHDEACSLNLASNKGKFDEWLAAFNADMNWFRDLVIKIYNSSRYPYKFNETHETRSFKYNGEDAYTALSGKSIYNNYNSVIIGESSYNPGAVDTNSTTPTEYPLLSNTTHSNPSFDNSKFKNYLDSVSRCDEYATYWSLPIKVEDVDPLASRKDSMHKVLGKSDYGYACAMYLSDISKYCDAALLMDARGKAVPERYIKLSNAGVVGILGNFSNESGFNLAQYGIDTNKKPAGGLMAFNGFQLEHYYKGYCPKTNKSIKVYNQHATIGSEVECSRCDGVHTLDEILDVSKITPEKPYEKGGFAQLVFFSNLFVARTLGYKLNGNDGNNYNGFSGYSAADSTDALGKGMYELMCKDYWQNPQYIIDEASKSVNGIKSYVGLIAQCWFVIFYFNVMHRESDVTSGLYNYMSLRGEDEKVPDDNASYMKRARYYWSNYFINLFGKAALDSIENMYVGNASSTKKSMTPIEYIAKMPNSLAGAMYAAAIFCIICEKPQNATNPDESKNSAIKRAKSAQKMWSNLS